MGSGSANWKDSTEGAIVRYNRQTDTFRFFSKEDLPLKSIETPITRIHALTVDGKSGVGWHQRRIVTLR